MRTSKKFIAGSAAAAVALSMMAGGAAFGADQNPITGDKNREGAVAAGSYEGRLGGMDRFGTAISAAKAAFPNGFDNVIIASYTSWADVLSAAPLADVLNAPILFTKGSALNADTKAYLKDTSRLERVYIIGGEGVVSPAVFNELRGLDGVTHVERIGGSDRYETSLLLAAQTVAQYGVAYDTLSPISNARAAITAIDDREAAYQKALADYEAQREVIAKAQLAADEAAAKEAAELAKYVELSKGLKPVGDVTQEELNEQINIAGKASRDLEAVTTITSNVTELVRKYHAAVKQEETKQGTVQDVIDYYEGEGAGEFESFSYEATDPTTYAVSTVTIDNIRDAFIVAGNPAGTDEAQAVVETFAAWIAQSSKDAMDEGAELSRLAKLIADQDLNEGVNAEIVKKLAAQWLTYQDAVKANKAAQDKLTKELKKGSDVYNALKAALAKRPTATERLQAVKVLEATIANAIADGTDHPAFLASGLDYADALSAGPAAAKEAGVVLLTKGTAIPAETQRYLSNKALKIAVGGQAAAAAGDKVTSYVGANRYETAVKVAEVYFGGAKNYIGLASGEGYADAVVAGATLANLDSTIVLTRANSLPAVTENYLRYNGEAEKLFVFGGTASISDAVRDAAKNAIDK